MVFAICRWLHAASDMAGTHSKNASLIFQKSPGLPPRLLANIYRLVAVVIPAHLRLRVDGPAALFRKLAHAPAANDANMITILGQRSPPKNRSCFSCAITSYYWDSYVEQLFNIANIEKLSRRRKKIFCDATLFRIANYGFNQYIFAFPSWQLTENDLLCPWNLLMDNVLVICGKLYKGLQIPLSSNVLNNEGKFS